MRVMALIGTPEGSVSTAPPDLKLQISGQAQQVVADATNRTRVFLAANVD